MTLHMNVEQIIEQLDEIYIQAHNHQCVNTGKGKQYKLNQQNAKAYICDLKGEYYNQVKAECVRQKVYWKNMEHLYKLLDLESIR